MSTISYDELIEEIKGLNLDFNPDKLNPEKSLSDQGVDSLDLAHLVFGIEDKYSVTISEDLIRDGLTFKAILEEINKL